MDKGRIKKLNHYHVIFLAQNVMIGIGLLSLPHALSPMEHDQWIMPILFGLTAQVILIPMVWICSKYPDHHLYHMNEKLIGKALGKGVNLIIIFYAIAMLATVSEGYARLIQITTLPNMTTTIPLILLFALIVYIAQGGIKSVARFCIIGFVFTGWMVYFLQWPFQKGDLGQVLPLLHFKPEEAAESFHRGFFSMLGFELILIYFPYIMNQKKAFRHASYGIWITVFFYFSISLASAAFFSSWQLKNLLYPVLNIYKSVELSWIERVENVGINLWVFLILSTTAAYLWAAKIGLDSLFGTRRRIHLYIPAVIAFGLTLGPVTENYKNLLYKNSSTFIGYGVMLWPMVLLLVYGIRRWMGRSS
jgi:spore germination protein AB